MFLLFGVFSQTRTVLGVQCTCTHWHGVRVFVTCGALLKYNKPSLPLLCTLKQQNAELPVRCALIVLSPVPTTAGKIREVKETHEETEEKITQTNCDGPELRGQPRVPVTALFQGNSHLLLSPFMSSQVNELHTVMWGQSKINLMIIVMQKKMNLIKLPETSLKFPSVLPHILW